MNNQKNNRKGKTPSEVQQAARNLANRIKGPLLLMYYPEDAEIEVADIAKLYKVLRKEKLATNLKNRIPTLNVVLHTEGGDSNASYRIAQLLHDFAQKVTFIIPEYAYSGGAMITLAGEKIILAHYAVLSPINVITGNDFGETREPVAMKYYIKMAADAKAAVVKALEEAEAVNTDSTVENALMTAMIENPINAMYVAQLYQQYSRDEKHALQLLKNYMLKDKDPEERDKVIQGLIYDSPDHEMDMDYHICQDIGLIVKEADQELSDLSKKLVRTLENATKHNKICRRTDSDTTKREPHFHYTPQYQARPNRKNNRNNKNKPRKNNTKP